MRISISKFLNHKKLANQARLYDYALDQAEMAMSIGNYGRALTFMHGLAAYCTDSGDKGLCDLRIEKLIVKVSDAIVARGANSSIGRNDTTMSRKKRVVWHVVTVLLPVGGHTRLILNWVRNDVHSQHHVLVTSQTIDSIPSWFLSGIRQQSGKVISVSQSEDLFERASSGARFLGEEECTVLLHHHSYDVVAVAAAVGSRSNLFAIVNHGDHLFSVGTSLANLLVEVRPSSVAPSLSHRFAKSSRYLPIPLDPNLRRIPRHEARAKLGLKPDDLVLISMGSAWKYRPVGSDNFLELVRPVLAKHRAAKLLLIGCSTHDAESYGWPVASDQIWYCGNVEDASIYLSSGDIYLEGLPFGSTTAFLEGCAFGLFPMTWSQDWEDSCFPAGELLPRGMGVIATSRQAYREALDRLLSQPEDRNRLVKQIADAICIRHSGDLWRLQVSEIYSSIGTKSTSENRASTSNWDSNQIKIQRILAQMRPHRRANSLFTFLVISNAIKSRREIIWQIPMVIGRGEGRDFILIAKTLLPPRIRQVLKGLWQKSKRYLLYIHR